MIAIMDIPCARVDRFPHALDDASQAAPRAGGYAPASGDRQLGRLRTTVLDILTLAAGHLSRNSLGRTAEGAGEGAVRIRRRLIVTTSNTGGNCPTLTTCSTPGTRTRRSGACAASFPMNQDFVDRLRAFIDADVRFLVVRRRIDPDRSYRGAFPPPPRLRRPRPFYFSISAVAARRTRVENLLRS
jgi:hypothetical protein